MSESIMERLRYHAQDMYNTAFSRSTMREAEAEITRLTACLRYEQHRAERVGTHGPGCKHWGPAHYECAMSALTEAEAGAERYRAALEWMQRQDLDDLRMMLVAEANHDGEYYVCGDSNKPGYGPTLLDAVESAALAEQEPTR